MKFRVSNVKYIQVDCIRIFNWISRRRLTLLTLVVERNRSCDGDDQEQSENFRPHGSQCVFLLALQRIDWLRVEHPSMFLYGRVSITSLRCARKHISSRSPFAYDDPASHRALPWPYLRIATCFSEILYIHSMYIHNFIFSKPCPWNLVLQSEMI